MYIYFVKYADCTPDEPGPGWYISGDERAEDSAPLIHGPFSDREGAEDYTEMLIS